MRGCQRILVPLDGSKRAERAVSRAIDISRSRKARLFLLRVIEPPAAETVVAVGPLAASSPASLGLISEAQEQAQAEAQEYLSVLSCRLTEKEDIECVPLIERGRVVKRIAESAERVHADLIVMTSRRRTALATAIFGSVSLDVLHRVRCPVLFAPMA